MIDVAELAPYLAPLSRPAIEQAATLQHVSLSQYSKEIETPGTLTTQFQATRKRVYDILSPIVIEDALSTDWFVSQLGTLSPKKPSHETISRWRDRGLLFYQGYNKPNPDSAACLLTLRILAGTTKVAKWTPADVITKEEPLYYCWRQDGPNAPMLPEPIPLSRSVPANALLWTPWLGASWQPEWLPVGTLGSARWAGTRIEKNTLIWDIDERDLQIWDPALSPLGKGIIKQAPLTLHTLATLALLRLATARLQQKTG